MSHDDFIEDTFSLNADETLKEDVSKVEVYMLDPNGTEIRIDDGVIRPHADDRLQVPAVLPKLDLESNEHVKAIFSQLSVGKELNDKDIAFLLKPDVSAVVSNSMRVASEDIIPRLKAFQLVAKTYWDNATLFVDKLKESGHIFDAIQLLLATALHKKDDVDRIILNHQSLYHELISPGVVKHDTPNQGVNQADYQANTESLGRGTDIPTHSASLDEGAPKASPESFTHKPQQATPISAKAVELPPSMVARIEELGKYLRSINNEDVADKLSEALSSNDYLTYMDIWQQYTRPNLDNNNLQQLFEAISDTSTSVSEELNGKDAPALDFDDESTQVSGLTPADEAYITDLFKQTDAKGLSNHFNIEPNLQQFIVHDPLSGDLSFNQAVFELAEKRDMTSTLLEAVKFLKETPSEPLELKPEIEPKSLNGFLQSKIGRIFHDDTIAPEQWVARFLSDKDLKHLVNPLDPKVFDERVYLHAKDQYVQDDLVRAVHYADFTSGSPAVTPFSKTSGDTLGFVDEAGPPAFDVSFLKNVNTDAKLSHFEKLISAYPKPTDLSDVDTVFNRSFLRNTHHLYTTINDKDVQLTEKQVDQFIDQYLDPNTLEFAQEIQEAFPGIQEVGLPDEFLEALFNFKIDRENQAGWLISKSDWFNVLPEKLQAKVVETLDAEDKLYDYFANSDHLAHCSSAVQKDIFDRLAAKDLKYEFIANTDYLAQCKPRIQSSLIKDMIRNGMLQEVTRVAAVVENSDLLARLIDPTTGLWSVQVNEAYYEMLEHPGISLDKVPRHLRLPEVPKQIQYETANLSVELTLEHFGLEHSGPCQIAIDTARERGLSDIDIVENIRAAFDNSKEVSAYAKTYGTTLGPHIHLIHTFNVSRDLASYSKVPAAPLDADQHSTEGLIEHYKLETRGMLNLYFSKVSSMQPERAVQVMRACREAGLDTEATISHLIKVSGNPALVNISPHELIREAGFNDDETITAFMRQTFPTRPHPQYPGVVVPDYKTIYDHLMDADSMRMSYQLIANQRLALRGYLVDDGYNTLHKVKDLNDFRRFNYGRDYLKFEKERFTPLELQSIQDDLKRDLGQYVKESQLYGVRSLRDLRQLYERIEERYKMPIIKKDEDSLHQRLYSRLNKATDAALEPLKSRLSPKELQAMRKDENFLKQTPVNPEVAQAIQADIRFFYTADQDMLNQLKAEKLDTLEDLQKLMLNIRQMNRLQEAPFKFHKDIDVLRKQADKGKFDTYVDKQMKAELKAQLKKGA